MKIGKGLRLLKKFGIALPDWLTIDFEEIGGGLGESTRVVVAAYHVAIDKVKKLQKKLDDGAAKIADAEKVEKERDAALAKAREAEKLEKQRDAASDQVIALQGDLEKALKERDSFKLDLSLAKKKTSEVEGSLEAANKKLTEAGSKPVKPESPPAPEAKPAKEEGLPIGWKVAMGFSLVATAVWFFS